MKIDDLLIKEGPQDYYDPSFRDVLEAHMSYLRSSTNTYSAQVTPHDTIVYNQDLYGFLLEKNVPMHLHWLVMRINNFYSPYDFTDGCTSLLIPNGKDVDKLRQSWRTTPVIAT